MTTFVLIIGAVLLFALFSFRALLASVSKASVQNKFALFDAMVAVFFACLAVMLFLKR